MARSLPRGIKNENTDLKSGELPSPREKAGFFPLPGAGARQKHFNVIKGRCSKAKRGWNPWSPSRGEGEPATKALVCMVRWEGFEERPSNYQGTLEKHRLLRGWSALPGFKG